MVSELYNNYPIQENSGTNIYIEICDKKYEELKENFNLIKDKLQLRLYKMLVQVDLTISLNLNSNLVKVEYKDILKWNDIKEEKKN